MDTLISTLCACLLLIHLPTLALATCTTRHRQATCSYDSVDGVAVNVVGTDAVTLTLTVRSRLECSRRCSQHTDCCGFGYVASGKLCVLITSGNILAIVSASAATQDGGSNIYLDRTCSGLYQGGSTTSTNTTPSQATAAATTVNVTDTTNSTTTLAATTSSETTPNTTTTQAATTPAATTPTTTTASATTQNTTTTLVTTTQAATTTNTTPTTPNTTTTQTATTPAATTQSTATTANTTGQCIANALFCVSGVVYVITPDSLLQYSSIESLVTAGPVSTTALDSVFTNVQGTTIVAAYTNASSSSLNIITGTHVQMYSSTTFDYIGHSTLFDHFRISLNSSIVSALQLTDSSAVYLFTHDDWLHIVTSDGNVTVVDLDKNTSINPYRCEIKETRARDVTAACAIDADRHLFVSSNALYLFDHGERRWSYLGLLHC